MGNDTTDADTPRQTGTDSLRVGSDASATGNNATSVGEGSVASGDNATTLGQGAAATGTNATAIGQGSAARDNATSIGQGAFASGNNSVAIGKDSEATNANEVSFGTADNTRQLTNVSAGAGTINVSTSAGNVPFADLTNATKTNVLTVADAQNMGWVVATPDKGYSAAVKNTNTVNFLGSDGIEVEGENNATSGVYDVKFRLSQAGRLYLENVTSSTPGSGQAQNTGRVSYDPANANGFVGAKTVANMINGSGWRTNSTTATGGATEQLISAGEFVNFEAGKNMKVEQTVNATTGDVAYTYSTKDQVEFDKVTVANGTTTTTIGGNGLTIADTANPNATTTVGIDGTRITGEDGKSANYTLGGSTITDGTNTTTVTAGETKVTDGTNSTTTTAGKTVLTDGTNTTTVSNDGTRITGANNATTDYTLAGVTVSDGANSTTTVGKDGLTVKGTNGTTSVGDNGLTIKDGTNSTTLGRDNNGNFNIIKNGDTNNATTIATSEDIKNVGFNLTTTGGTPQKVNNGDTVTFAAGNNMNVTQNGTTITYSVVENPKFSTIQVGNANMTTNATTGAIVFSNTTTNAPVQITGVANGTISANSTDAVNGSQIYALNNGNTINYNATTGVASTTVTSTDENGNSTTKTYTLTTYNVEGQTEFVTNSVVTAIHNMNEQGIKFFHTNDGNVTTIVQDRNGIDSSAKGAYATAIGAKSEANGKESIALGYGSQANALQTIAIGTGNIVNGEHSGAIGDPTIVNATSSYSVGNNNRITATSDNTFVLGNNVTVTTDQSVFLGSNVGYVAAPEVDQNGNLVESSAVTTAGKAGLEGQVTGGVYNAYAGGKANEVVGVVSVGNVGVDANGKLVQQTRRIQNVAPGLISEHSTDAVNGSQLYSVASNFNHKLGDLNNKINRSNKEHRAGIAGANAAAGLPQVYAAGKSMLAASAGTYKGQSALAVGYSRASDNGKVILKLQGNTNTGGDFGGSVGVGYQW